MGNFFKWYQLLEKSYKILLLYFVRVLEKLKVFVSSRTRELRNERVIIKEALENVNVETFIFEEDAGARTENVQHVYVTEVENCDIYVLPVKCVISVRNVRVLQSAQSRERSMLRSSWQTL